MAVRFLAGFAVGSSLLGGAAVQAEPCKPPRAAANGAAAQPCKPPSKIEPYDPDRVPSGSRPGFIDLGNGTEVRLGGRARLDSDMRR